MKTRFFMLLMLVSSLVLAQVDVKKSKSVSAKITYKYISNGQEDSERGKMILEYSQDIAKLYRKYPADKKFIPTMPNESEFILFAESNYYKTAKLNDGKVYSVVTPFDELPKPELTSETSKILGYNCKKAKVVIRSNNIEIWFTEELQIKGTPSPRTGLPGGIVLKIVQNGNFETVAESIEIIKKKGDIIAELPATWGEKLSAPDYAAKLTNSYITTVKVFENEQISFGNPINNPTENIENITLKYSSGTVILKKVKLPTFNYDHQVFAELVQYSNGDAYDRTGSVFMVPVTKEKSFLDALTKGIAEIPSYKGKNGKNYQGVIATENYLPIIELMRFFTPFGIRQYNNQVKVAGLKWEDSVIYKQDISEYYQMLQGEAWIGAFIGNYDKGGHIVDLTIKYYPNDNQLPEKPSPKKWFSPLFNTVNVMEMSGQEYGTMFDNDSLTVSFDVPEGLKNVHLQYITTGHGGWGGGDEFNLKVNEIFLDGKLIYSFGPWRCDCATYRTLNPASGNFWNGVSSSDYSRSGWCPGTITNPNTIPINDLKPGRHTIKVAIPLGKPEGGSFSAWNVSGVLIGEY
ncbi:MAG: GLPGLI family protein [Tenuifilaceae bacterium]